MHAVVIKTIVQFNLPELFFYLEMGSNDKIRR